MVGAGLMGREIAYVAAAAGLAVRLRDVNADALARAIAHITTLSERQVERGKASPGEHLALTGRVSAAADDGDLSVCDLVIEAVSEVMATKLAVLAAIDRVLPEGAIIASNTSGLSITELARATGRPAQTIGMHFFNPARVMPLVEIIRGTDTSDETLAATVALTKTFGKTPVVVAECPGFLVNRILCRGLAEAYRAAAETGAPFSASDASVVASGPAPMGPFELGDLVGLDTLAHVLDDLTTAYGERFADAGLTASCVADGHLGAKSGRGFYEGKPTPGVPDSLGDAVASRYYLGAFDEACRALEEEVAALPDIDTAMRLGAGWHSGPLSWADSEGLPVVAERLTGLSESVDARFVPRQPLLSRIRDAHAFAEASP